MFGPLSRHADFSTITHTSQQIHFIHWNAAFDETHGSAWMCLWLWLKQLPLTLLKSVSLWKRCEGASPASQWEQNQEVLLSSLPSLSRLPLFASPHWSREKGRVDVGNAASGAEVVSICVPASVALGHVSTLEPDNATFEPCFLLWDLV